jgi:hypothetical protein
VAVPTLATLIVITRHILFGEIYGEQDVFRAPSAVLVQTTGERRVITVDTAPDG